jgi:L,D-peptidoglycan transpeptidase YkuD (ErfK/YbiS/YcfS/YnhG family)
MMARFDLPLDELARYAPAVAEPADFDAFWRATPGQVVTVKAAGGTATTATVEGWELTSTGAHRRVAGPIQAYVGAAGVGQAHEGSMRTPQGVSGLSHAFGIAANPGTALPRFQVDNSDWWDEDAQSARYNQHVRCAPGSCPFRESVSEHLADYAVQYRYAVFFDYNVDPVVPGAGSGFFLHVANGQPTAGCVGAAGLHGLVAALAHPRPAPGHQHRRRPRRLPAARPPHPHRHAPRVDAATRPLPRPPVGAAGEPCNLPPTPVVLAGGGERRRGASDAQVRRTGAAAGGAR